MWENLLSSGLSGGSNHFPDSGPGSKNLIAGDEQLGYFGEVSVTSMFTPDQLCNELGGYYPGVTTPEENGWYKFFYNGKVLYIAKRAVRSAVSWTDLYENGLVYGTKDNGKYPTVNPTYQFRQVAKLDNGRQWPFLVRLPTVMDTDPAAVPGATTSGSVSEWSQLLGRIAAGPNNGLPKWAEIPSADMAVTDRGITTVHSWGVETQSTANANKAVGGYFQTYLYRSFEPGGTISRFNANYGTGYFGWRPVLELIPGSKINPPYKVNDAIGGPKQITIRDAVAQAGIKRPQYVHPTNWAYGAITIKDPTWTLSFPRAVRFKTVSPDLNAFTISGSYVA